MTGRFGRLSRTSSKPPPVGSLLRVQQYLDDGDVEGFVDELCRVEDADSLGRYAQPLYRDPRSTARKGLLKYVLRSMRCYRHEAIVKRLFKLAEANHDDEVMGHFMVALDRSLSRVLQTRNRYDWTVGDVVRVDRIVTQSQVMPKDARPARPKFLYSLATRRYLRRRAWRYFRTIDDETRYVASISKTIAIYDDADTENGLAILDKWGLTHVLFHHCEAIRCNPGNWKLADGRGFGDLAAAPYREGAYAADALPLLELCENANGQTVRMWAIELLRKHHRSALVNLDIDRLLRWIAADDALADIAVGQLRDRDDVQQFAPEDWLRLFDRANSSVLQPLTDIAAEQNAPQHWPIETLLELALHQSSALVGLAKSELANRPMLPQNRDAWFDLIDAPCASHRYELAEMTLDKWVATNDRDDALLMHWIDATDPDVRLRGLRCLDPSNSKDSNSFADPLIWQRCLESPYDDVQLWIADHLASRSLHQVGVEKTSSLIPDPASMDTATLHRLWATVLLNTGRGGRTKIKLIDAIADIVDQQMMRQSIEGDGSVASPEDSTIKELLSMMTTMLRSIRVTEFRAALAALTRLVERHPSLADAIGVDALDFVTETSPN